MMIISLYETFSVIPRRGITGTKIMNIINVSDKYWQTTF